MLPQERVSSILQKVGLTWQLNYSFGTHDGIGILLVPETIAHELGHYWHFTEHDPVVSQTPTGLNAAIQQMSPERRLLSECEARATNYIVSKQMRRDKKHPWVGTRAFGGVDRSTDDAVLQQSIDRRTLEVAERALKLLRRELPVLYFRSRLGV